MERRGGCALRGPRSRVCLPGRAVLRLSDLGCWGRGNNPVHLEGLRKAASTPGAPLLSPRTPFKVLPFDQPAFSSPFLLFASHSLLQTCPVLDNFHSPLTPPAQASAAPCPGPLTWAGRSGQEQIRGWEDNRWAGIPWIQIWPCCTDSAQIPGS